MAYSRYKNIPSKRDATGRQLTRSTIYPPIPRHDDDIYVITTVGDTLYALSETYYGSVDYYWVIGEANENLKKRSQNIPSGLQLRIPSQLNLILRAFEDLNNPLI